MYKVVVLYTACLVLFGCSKVPEFDQSELSPAGDMTAKRVSHRTYVVEGQGVTAKQKLDFWTGFSLFRDPWVIAPSSTTDRDGLGPLFNTRSCISCHLRGGRGPEPQEGVSTPVALIIRLGLKDNMGIDQPFSETKTHQQYGEQIQPRAINITHPSRLPEAVQAEAKLKIEYEMIQGVYTDGEAYELRKPNYQLVDLKYGDIPDAIGISPRFSPVVYGTGLLDAIDEEDLLAQADPNDEDGDGISGRYNMVPTVKMYISDSVLPEGTKAIGRFGHKAKHATLGHQVAAAFRDDIGITNSWFPEESCSKVQDDCRAASEMGKHKDVEIPDKLLKLVIDTNQFMAVSPARKLNSEASMQGRNLFYEGGCASCHTPSYVTSKDYPVDVLANQKIWPYTDLALHDMGPGLADGVTENLATGQEWRTPPLWGLGAQKIFRKEALYLHDGRARSLEEAILWHGGEAQASQTYFINLSKIQRQQLVAFLDSI